MRLNLFRATVLSGCLILPMALAAHGAEGEPWPGYGTTTTTEYRGAVPHPNTTVQYLPYIERKEMVEIKEMPQLTVPPVPADIGMVMEQPAVIVLDAPKKKLRFGERHPVVHRAFRKTRHVCLILQPVASFAGSISQIVGLFVL